jgi:hypothetical protein
MASHAHSSDEGWRNMSRGLSCNTQAIRELLRGTSQYLASKIDSIDMDGLILSA